jgi:transposase
MPRPRKYPDELMQRGVRLVFESGRPIAQVAADLGVHHEALRKRVRRAEADSGKRSDILTTQERDEIRMLRKENQQLRRAKEGTTHCPPRWFPGAGAGCAPAACVGGLLA